jgi:nucleoside-diphosphate-sugar epimerase
VRDFLHVADVAGAFVQLLESDVRGPVNIASGQGVSLGRVASILAQIIGRKDLLQVDALRPSADNPGILTADVTRLRNEVGWRATYGLESGLVQTVEWWKQQRE